MTPALAQDFQQLEKREVTGGRHSVACHDGGCGKMNAEATTTNNGKLSKLTLKALSNTNKLILG